MRYVVRADASQSIGTGHVMRSSAIAEELIGRGETVVFVGRISDLPWVEERIAEIGFSHICSNPGEFISNPESDVLLLDSYDVAIDDEFIKLEKWFHIVTIVDELTPNYSCALRIHPGLDSDWVGESSISILSGPNYIPIRSSLSKNISTSSRILETLKIVVVAGGSDPHNLVLEISKVLATFSESFDVYFFTNTSSVFARDSRFHFCKIGLLLDEVSRDADLILTTSSTSSLEFIARGFCVGVACAVENQKQYYDILAQLGLAAQIGCHSLSSGWKIEKDTIHKLITEASFRADLANKGFGLIDFNGASRIVDAIMSL
jgi:spore coat polysaccharide biosynthesis predicted glycosyltransferase SpsG